MRGAFRVAGLALAASGCLDEAGPTLAPGALRPPAMDQAVVQSVGEVAVGQAAYTVRLPLTPPLLLFDGPDGAMLRLRYRDLTRVGTVTTDGQLVVFEWTAPGGRVFSPESLCALTLFDPLDATTAPWIEGRTICEARADDGTRATVAAAFVVSEP